MSRPVAGWKQLTPPSNPDDRYSMGMAYDDARANSVMFGGFHGAVLRDETWTYDSATGQWTQESPGTVPDERAQISIAYHASADVSVMFGGITTANVTIGDTWTWDGTDWTLETPGTSPAPRALYGLAYDIANDRTVLYGGAIPSVGSTETWTWDGSDWTLETPSTNPGQRRAPAMAYDAARGKVVLFGGDDKPTATDRKSVV